MFPFLLKLYADGGYQGPEFRRALKTNPRPASNIEIVKRRIKPKASSSCQNAGSSSEPSLGSAVAAGSPRTGKTSIARRLPSYASLPSGSCCI